MDEIFGTAYGDLVELELSAFRRDLEMGRVQRGITSRNEVDGKEIGERQGDEPGSIRERAMGVNESK
jgi:hypothetical protein